MDKTAKQKERRYEMPKRKEKNKIRFQFIPCDTILAILL